MIVSDVLAALEGMPGVVDPTGTRDAEGVLSASFTMLETGLDSAGDRARDAFGEAIQRAGVNVQWRVIDIDEGPPVDHGS